MFDKKISRLFTGVFLFLVTLVGIPQKVFAQDVTYSQFMANPTLTNPGLITLGQYVQASLSYRYQPLQVGGNFSTLIAYMRYPFLRKYGKKTRGALGLTLLYDNQATLITESGALATFAYTFGLKKGQLSLGGQMGFFQRSLNPSSFSTDSQFDDRLGFNPVLSPNESLNVDNTTYPVFSGGVLWSRVDAWRRKKVYLGFSWFNINEPDVSFIPTQDFSVNLPSQRTLIGGYAILSRPNFRIIPNFRWTQRLNFNRIQIGTWVDFNLYPFQEKLRNKSFSIGVWYSHQQAFIIGAKLDKPEYTVSLSYDLPIAEQAPNWLGDGAIEFTWALKWPRKKKSKALKPQEIIPDYVTLGPTFSPNKHINLPLPSSKNPSPDTILLKNKSIDFQVITVRFSLGQTGLGTLAKRNLDYLASFLAIYSETDIVVTGYTCNLGSHVVNQKISEQRAQRVKNYLVNKGVHPSRIQVIGAAESNPLVSNATEQGRRKNRRVEISPLSPHVEP